MANIIRVSGIPLASMLIALAWGAQPAAAQTSDASANWDAIAKCATINNDIARLECADTVLRPVGIPKAADTMEAPAKTVAAVPSQLPRVADLTAPERESFLPTEPTAEEEAAEIDQVEFTLKKVTKAGNGKYTLTTTDGITWRQLYRKPAQWRPDVRKLMTVKKGAIGGYLCRVGKSQSFRCLPLS